jgi:hypothetical protein
MPVIEFEEVHKIEASDEALEQSAGAFLRFTGMTVVGCPPQPEL